MVVQPGVEFGDDQIFLYDHEAATQLCEKLKEYPDFVLEGHSTDYQSRECLRSMAEDGICILKVGPALTYAYREALFALSMIERELVDEGKQAKVIEVLDEVMLESPDNWKKHYHGTDREQKNARKYSLSDRARYYIGDPRIEEAVKKLYSNLRESRIPMNMIHQYMPLQFDAVRGGRLKPDPQMLVMDAIEKVLEEYEYATGPA